MKIILTRHGETIENRMGITQGHLPGKLTKEGVEQAKKLAMRLKDEKIDAIYSSDLARAADTTKEIIKFHPDVNVSFVKELRERNLGEFEGTNWCDFELNTRKFNPSLPQPKQGETREEMCSRARRLFDRIFEKHEDETILLVGHGGINTAIISAITGKPLNDALEMWGMDNTSVYIFEIGKDKSHKIHCINCTKHLE